MDAEIEEARTFREVDRNNWEDFQRLFEERGGPSYCWCMLWRSTAEELRHNDRPNRKAAMERRVMGGTPVGILAYDGAEPVAWCSIAPRKTYRRLGGIEEPGEDETRVWSLVCFFIKRAYRGRGVSTHLIQAATEHARSRGAAVIEAYPVDPHSPSYRFMGLVSTFEAAGFQDVGRAGSRRHVLRKTVG